MFGIFHSNHATFHSDHDNRRLQDTAYVDRTSFKVDEKEQTLTCVIFRVNGDIYSMEQITLFYGFDNFGQFRVNETSHYDSNTGKYSNHEVKNEMHRFSEEQDDPIGILYNRTIEEFHFSPLPMSGEMYPVSSYRDEAGVLHEFFLMLRYLPHPKGRGWFFFLHEAVRSSRWSDEWRQYFIFFPADGTSPQFVCGALYHGDKRQYTYLTAKGILPDEIIPSVRQTAKRLLQDDFASSTEEREKITTFAIQASTKEQQDLQRIFGDVIGAQSIVDDIYKKYVMSLEMRGRKKHAPEPLCLAFVGNVGCGKEYLARKVAALYQASGLLASNAVVSCAVDGLFVGPNVGDAANALSKEYKNARGGTLILTGLESLRGKAGSKWDGTNEVMSRLMMEINADAAGTIIIVTSTEDGIDNVCRRVPAFKSRFATRIHFTDFSVDELTRITEKKIHDMGFPCAKECTARIAEYLDRKLKLEGDDAGNGDLAESTAKEAVQNMTVRVRTNGGDASTRCVLPNDIPSVTKRNDAYDLEQDFATIYGLESVKDELRKINRSILAEKLLRENPDYQGQNLHREKKSYHMAFLGNPGTGKTTFAKIMGKILFNLGVTSKQEIVETRGSELVKSLDATRRAFKAAMGGVLFIDEAYAIAETSGGYASDVVNELVPLMENYMENIVVILAGYTQPMERLFEMNPGLKSRINRYIEFPDYSIDELVMIAKKKAHPYFFDAGAEQAFAHCLKRAKADAENFANVRTVRNIWDKVQESQRDRLLRDYGLKMNQLPKDVIYRVTAEDFTEMEEALS